MMLEDIWRRVLVKDNEEQISDIDVCVLTKRDIPLYILNVIAGVSTLL